MKLGKKELREKLKANTELRVAVIAAVCGALASLIVGWFNYQNRDRELDLELAKIALSILSGEYDVDQEKTPLPARYFALNALEAGTGVEISERDKELWATKGDTPFWGAIDVDIDKILPAGKRFNSNFMQGYTIQNNPAIEVLPAANGAICVEDDETLERICGKLVERDGDSRACVRGEVLVLGSYTGPTISCGPIVE